MYSHTYASKTRVTGERGNVKQICRAEEVNMRLVYAGVRPLGISTYHKQREREKKRKRDINRSRGELLLLKGKQYENKIRRNKRRRISQRLLS